MDNEEYIIVCRPATTPPHVESYQGNCDECDCPIWIAYSSSEMMTIAGKKICVPCMLKRYSDDTEILAPEGQTLEEIMRKTGMTKQQAQQIPERVKQWIQKQKQNSIG